MKYDIYGIGNALVDAEYRVEDAFLQDESIAKAHMTLVDEERMAAIEARLEETGEPRTRMSGGSAANTVFAAHAFGGQGFYACRVADDDAGRHFLSELDCAGIATAGQRTTVGRTGRCLTLVTADAERTMTTCLGVSADFAAEDIDEPALADAAYLYVEGYLAASEISCAAAVLAREIGEEAGIRTSLSLSDPSMVENCRDALETMLGNGVHQLFCNAEEALAWAATDRLDVAVKELGDIAPNVNITLGAEGSLAVERGAQQRAAPFPATPVDTTGAGDIYAGAVIHARVNDADAATAARFANFAAAELVSRHGARFPNAAMYAALKARFKP